MNDITESIIKACAKGDSNCQKLIYETYYKKMYTICLRYSSNKEEAKDLLHDGFIKLFEKIKKDQTYNNFEAWTYRLFSNHCIDYVRSSYKKLTFNNLDEIEHSQNDANFNFDESDDAFDPLNYEPKELIEAIQLLPTDYKLVLNLFAIENKSHQEIADIMKIETSTSRSKLLRARLALKKLILKPNKHAKL